MKLSKPLRWTLEVALFLVIVYGISLWQARNMLDISGDTPVAQQNLVSLEGNVQPLYGRGKRTLVYFWAPWCTVCAISIDSLQNIEHKNLDVVTVAMDFESIETVTDFVSTHKVTAPVLLGNNQIRQQFKVQGYPSYYLLDEKGKVVARSIGLNTSFGIRLNDWLSRM